MSQTSVLASLLEDDNSRKQTLLRIVDDCHKDRSWRVRAALATDLGPIAIASGASFTADSLLNITTVLLSDPEPEVREIAIKQLSTMCKVVGPTLFTERMIPELNATRFTEEEEIKVQTAFAQAIMELIPMLGGEEGTIEVTKNQLMPLITEALTRQLDEESEGFQHMMQSMINMKLKVFRRMGDLMDVLEPEGAQSFTDDVLLSVVGQCAVSVFSLSFFFSLFFFCFLVLIYFFHFFSSFFVPLLPLPTQTHSTTNHRSQNITRTPMVVWLHSTTRNSTTGVQGSQLLTLFQK